MNDLPPNAFSVKMRASQKDDTGKECHISGAERIVAPQEVPATAAALSERALKHSKGCPDFINLKISAVAPEEIITLPALPVQTINVPTAQAGRQEMQRLLQQLLPECDCAAIMAVLEEAGGMRGAVLLDVDTLQRLEEDPHRGVRATNMDAMQRPPWQSQGKNHYAEAIVLATKVVNAPGIIGELCISDDPEYVTGYIASKSIGYVRITKLKEMGSPIGGRVFLYRGNTPEKTVEFLEKQCVVVKDVPPPPLPLPVKDSRWQSLEEELQVIRQKQLFRQCRVYASAPDATVTLAHSAPAIMMASNNYLGLAGDPRLRQAASQAALQWGAGTGGARLTTGTLPPHAELEEMLAQFKGTEEALLFNTGYMANLGTIQALCGKEDIIFSDALNHASIIDGCRLSGAQIVVYRHNDMKHLEQLLEMWYGGKYRRRLIVTDAVFSMDGDIAPLPELLTLAEKYDAFTMVDEAHATGVIGQGGTGIVSHFQLQRHPDITMGTLSKALGAEGGFVCGSKTLIQYLRNRARAFIFTTAMAPAGVAAATAAIDILRQSPQLPAKLRQSTQFFVEQLQSQGVAAVDNGSAIVPIVIGDEARTLAVAARAQENGVVVSPIRYPTVPKGAARLRATVMATHTKEQLSYAAKVIASAYNSQ